MDRENSSNRAATEADRRRREIAMIHIAKDFFAYDDAAYRSLIFLLCGGKKESAADMDALERRRLLDLFKAWGWEPKAPAAKQGDREQARKMERGPILGKIGAILYDMGLPWAYVDGMGKHMFGVDTIRWLSNEQLRRVSLALIYHQRRHKERLEQETQARALGWSPEEARP